MTFYIILWIISGILSAAISRFFIVEDKMHVMLLSYLVLTGFVSLFVTLVWLICSKLKIESWEI